MLRVLFDAAALLLAAAALLLLAETTLDFVAVLCVVASFGSLHMATEAAAYVRQWPDG